MNLCALLQVHESDPYLGLILVASDDGLVRGWRGFGERGEESIVSGFKAIPEYEIPSGTSRTMVGLREGSCSEGWIERAEEREGWAQICVGACAHANNCMSAVHLYRKVC